MKDPKGHGSNTDDCAGGQPVSSNAEAAQKLMGNLRSTQSPIHSGMLLRSTRDK